MLRPLAIVVLAYVALLASSGCVAPPHGELATARRALQQATTVQAEQWAAPTYAEAAETLALAEHAMASRDYRRAQELLPQAARLAELAENEARLAALAPPAEPVPPQPASASSPHSELPVPGEPVASPPRDRIVVIQPTNYTVSGSEAIWEIAARKEIYADPYLWPLIYRANRDQITDPRIIHPGQRLAIPRNSAKEELADARAAARKSDLFPLDALQRAASNGIRHPLP